MFILYVLYFLPIVVDGGVSGRVLEIQLGWDDERVKGTT